MSGSFRIESIDLAAEADEVLRGLRNDLTEHDLADLLLRTTNPQSPSVYMSARAADGVVGIVAFMAHNLRLNGRDVPAYQAAGVLTSSAHRGQGIFPAIVRESETFLRERGGAFIFGFPNANAYPVWTRKLGYGAVRTQRWRAPSLIGLQNLFIKNREPSEAPTIHQNDQEMISMKRRVYGENLFVAQENSSIVWGIRRHVHKLGIAIPVFDIGGLKVGNEQELRTLFKRVLAESGLTAFIRFRTVVGNPTTEFFSGMKTPTEAHEVMIVKELALNLDEAITYSFYGGITDSF